MTHRRPKSPGSFQDELSDLIERVAPMKGNPPPRRDKTERPVKSSADLNDRLFWRRPDE